MLKVESRFGVDRRRGATDSKNSLWEVKTPTMMATIVLMLVGICFALSQVRVSLLLRIVQQA